MVSQNDPVHPSDVMHDTTLRGIDTRAYIATQTLGPILNGMIVKSAGPLGPDGDNLSAAVIIAVGATDALIAELNK